MGDGTRVHRGDLVVLVELEAEPAAHVASQPKRELLLPPERANCTHARIRVVVTQRDGAQPPRNCVRRGRLVRVQKQRRQLVLPRAAARGVLHTHHLRSADPTLPDSAAEFE
eukprot:6207085-Pleurochrysis_carterae.AAC.3